MLSTTGFETRSNAPAATTSAPMTQRTTVKTSSSSTTMGTRLPTPTAIQSPTQTKRTPSPGNRARGSGVTMTSHLGRPCCMSQTSRTNGSGGFHRASSASRAGMVRSSNWTNWAERRCSRSTPARSSRCRCHRHYPRVSPWSSPSRPQPRTGASMSISGRPHRRIVATASICSSDRVPVSTLGVRPSRRWA